MLTSEDHLALEPWLVAHYLEDGRAEPLRAQFSLTVVFWYTVLALAWSLAWGSPSSE
ncbi:Uncharacterized [Moorella glycerini]|uniref:Uncharacterized protein n=1 Tax=Neomoorella stamsii TaxID=1266720 RepID=A0A9X7P6U1_9FIRM|nr:MULTISPECIES: hypothetical protein [Moorella]PRR74546.1 hypothetical protein MOST_09810 [Moorella stamsii]CEP69167.1 Uncharacterized [Moorella glycerini]